MLVHIVFVVCHTQEAQASQAQASAVAPVGSVLEKGAEVPPSSQRTAIAAANTSSQNVPGETYVVGALSVVTSSNKHQPSSQQHSSAPEPEKVDGRSIQGSPRGSHGPNALLPVSSSQEQDEAKRPFAGGSLTEEEQSNGKRKVDDIAAGQPGEGGEGPRESDEQKRQRAL